MGKSKDITLLEKYLGPGNGHDSFYSYELDGDNLISTLDIYEPEYDEMRFDGNIFDVISQLKHLQRVEISVYDYEITDISAIAKLRHLKELNIEYETGITNINCLAGLQDLEILNIGGGKISDISSLAGLLKLKTVNLPRNQISDISVLADKHELQTLGLNNNKITDITCVKTLKNLLNLSLSSNQISDFSVISSLEYLSNLGLDNNAITDVNFISELKKVTGLSLADNALTNVACIANFKELKYLQLGNNNINDLSFLAGLIHLVSLSVNNNPVTRFGDLSEQTQLSNLDASNIPNFDLSFIVGCKGLTYLSLRNCSISDDLQIAPASRLYDLRLDDNYIRDSSLLTTHKHIRRLSIRNNLIGEIFPSYSFPYLERLDLRGNPFGNKLFQNYRQGTEEPQGTLDELAKQVADYHFDKKEYDEALAYYYILSEEKRKLLIYFELFMQNLPSNTYFMRYYFIKCVGILKSHRFDTQASDVQDISIKLVQTMTESTVADRHALVASLPGPYQHYDQREDYRRFRDVAVDGQYHPEMLYHIGVSVAKKADLLKALYLYQLLVKIKSPFQYPLYAKIADVLKMNFSGVEREAREKYQDILDNVATISIPEFDYLKYRENQQVEYERLLSQSYRDVDWDLVRIWVLIIALIGIFIIKIMR